MHVYTENGMCIDTELIDGEGAGLKIIDQAVEDVYGGLLKKFSDVYFKHGGKGGGW